MWTPGRTPDRWRGQLRRIEFDGEEPVEYEPAGVAELLAEVRDTAELLVDSSQSAVLSGDRAVAAEVLQVDSRMDVRLMQDG